jgi:hypothetical protein
MILFTSTSDALQVVTGQARTVDVHADYEDLAAGVTTPKRKNTAITTAATTSVLEALSSSTARTLMGLLVRNKDVSACDVTVKHTDGATPVALFPTVTLAAGEYLEYVNGVGFRVYDVAGKRR